MPNVWLPRTEARVRPRTPREMAFKRAGVVQERYTLPPIQMFNKIDSTNIQHHIFSFRLPRLDIGSQGHRLVCKRVARANQIDLEHSTCGEHYLISKRKKKGETKKKRNIDREKRRIYCMNVPLSTVTAQSLSSHRPAAAFWAPGLTGFEQPSSELEMRFKIKII